MIDYSKLDILVMLNNCRTITELLEVIDTLKWLWALGENISFNYVREVAVKRTRELI